MKKMRRGFSLLLSIVMVLGMVPVQGFAADCQHTLTYSAEGECITAVCSNEGCAYQETATLVLDPEASLAYTGKEIKPLKVVYSEGWQGPKTDTVTYVHNVEVTKAPQEPAAEQTESQTVSAEPQPEDGEQEAPEGEEQKTPVEQKEEPKIPTGTLTIGGVSVSKTFAVGKAKLIVTAMAEAAYGDAEPVYTPVYKNAEGEPVEAVLSGEPGLTSSYTPEAEAETDFEIVVSLEGVTSEQYDLEAENGSFKVARKKLTLVSDTLAFDYDGQPHAPALTVAGLVGQDKVEPEYDAVTGTNAGTYTIGIKSWKGEEAVLKNYELPAETEIHFTVNPREVEFKLDKAEYVYDGEAHTPAVTIGNLVEGDQLELDYEPVTETNPGEYTIALKGFKTVEGHEDAADNYILPDNQVSFVIHNGIQAKPENVTAVKESVQGAADGRITGVDDTMEYKSGDGEYAPVTGTELTGLPAGTYFVRYAAKEHFDASEAVEVTVEPGNPIQIILPAEDKQIGYTLTADKTAVSLGESVTITYTLEPGYIELDAFQVKVNGEAVALEEGSYTIENIQQDAAVTVEGVEAAISMEFMDEEYHTVVDEITFAQYTNKKKTLTITSAWDAKIYYAEKDKKVDPAVDIPEVDWNLYEEGGVTIGSTDRKAVFYARVMDDAGNVHYASTNGVVFDTTPPVVKVNGETVAFDKDNKYSMDCYTKQIVMAEDENLSKITLNNANMSLTADIELAGNLNKRYNLRISDAAGNAVQLTVQMHPIEDLKKSAEDLNRLDEIIEEARTHATSNELAKLEEINENKKAYLAILLIQNLPDTADVQPYNEDHRDAYEAAQEAYDDLTETEKAIVGNDNKTHLQDVKAALAYDITTKAVDLRWAKSSQKDLTVKANGPNARFEELWINKKKVATTKYSHKADTAGGTVITIDEDYLDTFSVGEYVIKVVYEDGETDGNDKIVILKAGTNPKTGDEGILLWMAASVLSLACLAVIVPGRKRKFQA